MTTNEPVLELRDVGLRRNGKPILSSVTFSMGRGEHWAVIGPNGAGKSSILSLCGANAHPTDGTVSVLGQTIGRVDLQELRQRIGHVNPRHSLTSPLTIRQVVLTGLTGTLEERMRWTPSDHDQERADELLALFDLDRKSEERWTTLSQGERGRALIARALVGAPDLLLLDEPSSGLDVAAREQLIETLDALSYARPSLTSMLVTHHLEELPETTSHALLVSRGQVLAAGVIDETITSESISEAFEHPISVSNDGGRWSARTNRDPARAKRLASFVG